MTYKESRDKSAEKHANQIAFKAGHDHCLLESEIVKGLVQILNKIADPRKRDHQEPDKYTEVGCMINMAEEALEAYPPSRGGD